MVQFILDLLGKNRDEDITRKKGTKKDKKGIIITKKKQSFHIRVIPKWKGAEKNESCNIKRA